MLVSVYMCMHSVYIGLMITSCTILLVQGKGPPPATPTGLGPSSTDNLTASSGFSSNVGGASVGGGTPQGESAPIRAPMSLWQCSRIMHLLHDLHPTLLSALEGIVDQVSLLYSVTTQEYILNFQNNALITKVHIATLCLPYCRISSKNLA